MTISRRSFLGALAGLPVLGHVLQRAPLPTDNPLVISGNTIETVGVPHISVAGTYGVSSDYTITTTNVTGTVYGYQRGDEWVVVEHGRG